MTDSAGREARRSYRLRVNRAPPTLLIEPWALPEACRNVAYQTTVRASGGTGQGYRWSVVDGALPPSFTLEGAGAEVELSGVSPQPGAFWFRLRVEDSSGAAEEHTYTLVVQECQPAITIRTTILPNGRVGVPYSPNPPDGGPVRIECEHGCLTAMWSVVDGALPPGIMLSGDESNPRFGVLSGTPTAADT